MTTTFRAIITFAVTLFLSCSSQPSDITKSHKRDTTLHISKTPAFVDIPRSFVKNYGANDNDRLFVFVGGKIFVEPLPYERGSMDAGFKAKYVVLKKVYGSFPEDTIEFIAYDHYGIPEFSKFRNVLLYVSADSGTYYHQKYMYNDVYETKDGRWAGTYAYEDYLHENNKHTKIKPIKIDFAEKVVYPTVEINDEGRKRRRVYPKPYFKTIGDSAFAVYGNYIEELFKLKRDGFLTARKLFDDQ